jgi:hypothetical protein
MATRFFQIGGVGNGPWAFDYGPVESMPFLDESWAVTRMHRQAWSQRGTPPGLHLDPGGSRWLDFIGCGNPPPSFFVSETVIDDLEANGISISRKTEMPIASITGKRPKVKPPRYFVVEAAPGIDVDFAASGIACDPAGRPVLTNEQRLHPPLLQLSLPSWSGADLFSIGNYGTPLWLLCTERVKALAAEQKWSNIDFQRRAIAGVPPFSRGT